MAKFNPSNQPGTCLWCGRKVQPKYHVSFKRIEPVPAKPTCPKCGTDANVEQKYNTRSRTHDHYLCSCGTEIRIQTWIETRTKISDHGSYGPHFDTMSCAAAFGMTMAGFGRRLTKKEPE